MAHKEETLGASNFNLRAPLEWKRRGGHGEDFPSANFDTFLVDTASFHPLFALDLETEPPHPTFLWLGELLLRFTRGRGEGRRQGGTNISRLVY